MPIGPRGEKRPVSPVSNAVHILKVAAGITEEEYVDDKPWTDEEIVALRVAKAEKQKKTKINTKD